jgi:predicted N-acyltransferase
LFGERLGDEVLLILAYSRASRSPARSTSSGPTRIYGRYWGALVDKPFLHFELCYYQRIDSRSRAGWSEWRRALRAATSWRGATSRCRLGRAHYIVHDPGFARRWPNSSSASGPESPPEQLLLGERTPFRNEG